jgi:hypothetical protein
MPDLPKYLSGDNEAIDAFLAKFDVRHLNPNLDFVSGALTVHRFS